MLSVDLIKEDPNISRITEIKEVTMTPERLEVLRSELDRPSLKNLKDWKDIVGVEIGVQYGINAKDILMNYDIKTLYLVDPYTLFLSASEGKITGQNNPKIKKIAHEYLKEYEDKIVWIEEFSWNAVDLIPNELDFVYIDGDHRKEAVERDLKLYYPKVRSGGLFCGHDFDKRAPGVMQAVNGFLKGKQIFSGGKWDFWHFKE